MTRAGAFVDEPPVTPGGGAASVLITPKVLGLPVESPGFPGWKLLVTLNPSKRTSIFCCSRMANSRDNAVSHSQKPGPRIELWPRFPKVPRAGAPNAAGFKYFTQNPPAVPQDCPCAGEAVSVRSRL